MRLLIADDDSEVRRWLRLILRPLGVDVVEAADGVELLVRLRQAGPVDLVITDIRMPRQSGLDAAQRARDAGLQLPFIFITGHDSAATQQAVEALGSTLLLHKPFDGDVLVDAVRRLLQPAGGPAIRSRARGDANGGVNR